MVIPMARSDASIYKYPMPRHLLELNVIEAKDLIDADSGPTQGQFKFKGVVLGILRAIFCMGFIKLTLLILNICDFSVLVSRTRVMAFISQHFRFSIGTP